MRWKINGQARSKQRAKVTDWRYSILNPLTDSRQAAYASILLMSSRRHLGAVALGLVALSRASLAIAGNGTSPTPGIEGIWSDACPCAVPCPCWATHKPNVSHCTNIHFYGRINGSHRGTRVREGHFVVVGQSRHPGEAPAASTVYLDGDMDDSSRRAVRTMVDEMYGRLDDQRFITTAMRVVVRALAHEVDIPEVLRYRVAARRNAPAPVPSVADHLYKWLHNPRQGVAVSVRYVDLSGMTHSYRQANAVLAGLRLGAPAPQAAAVDSQTEHCVAAVHARLWSGDRRRGQRRACSTEEVPVLSSVALPQTTGFE